MIYFNLNVHIDEKGNDYINVRGETFKECVESIFNIINPSVTTYRFYLYYMGEVDSIIFCLGVKCFSNEEFLKFLRKTGVSDILLKERLY